MNKFDVDVTDDEMLEKIFLKLRPSLQVKLYNQFCEDRTVPKEKIYKNNEEFFRNPFFNSMMDVARIINNSGNNYDPNETYVTICSDGGLNGGPWLLSSHNPVELMMDSTARDVNKVFLEYLYLYLFVEE